MRYRHAAARASSIMAAEFSPLSGIEIIDFYTPLPFMTIFGAIERERVTL
jgi:hypothetical protein